MANELDWRIQESTDGGFDELVVYADGKKGKNPALIHAEMMNKRDIFVSIGSLRIWATVERGVARVTHTETDGDNESVRDW